MRVYALYLFVVSFAVLAVHNWFVSLCGLIPLTCFLQRRDVPKYIMGVQGLNPWNALMAFILFFWLLRRRSEGLRWDMPRYASILLLCYLTVLVVADARALLSLDSFRTPDKPEPLGFLTDNFINVVKFMILGLILYDACRTRQRVFYGVLVVGSTFLIYALLTIKYVPLRALYDLDSFMLYRHRIDRDTGLFATDMAMVCAGGAWGILAFWGLLRRRWQRIGILGAFLTIGTALALTHARGAYVAFVGLSCIYAGLRWRKIFLLYPVFAVLIIVFMPTIPARLGMGLGQVQVTGEEAADMDEVTSGRMTALWPPAMEEIANSPVIGHGRRAVWRTPYYNKVTELEGGCPSHPHNAYLELLMDTGIVGFIPVVTMFFAIAWMSVRLFRSRTDLLETAVGGLSLGCIGTLLICSLGSQSFFGTQSMMGFWCAWGLALRMHVDRAAARRAGPLTGVTLRSPVSAHASRYGVPGRPRRI